MKELDLTTSYTGVRVLLRASLNVPVEGGCVTNPYRLERALPTIEALSARGARVIVIGHLGEKPTDSLRPVWEAAQHLTSVPIRFIDRVIGSATTEAVAATHDGEVIMLENVRRDKGETANDPTFAKALAALGDLYVDDAFSDAHRAHASIVGIPALIPGVAGPSFMAEYTGIKPALTPPSPSLAIIGGAKFGTKEPLIRTLLQKYDHVFVGGAIADDFFKAKGYEVGRSLVSDIAPGAELLKNSKLILPEDVVVETVDGSHEVRAIGDIAPTDTVFDVGPHSLAALAPLIAKARLILWNGPLGNFEKGYREQTDRVARLVLEARGQSVIGGGDTIAAVNAMVTDGHKKNNFVSTAGGAMLTFIAEGTLPGIEALN